MPLVSREVWTELIAASSNAHVLQTPAWGDLKALYGWESCYLVSGKIGAQILFQSVPFGFQVAYIPRGPLTLDDDLDQHPDWPGFLEELDRICRERRVVFLKIEPDSWVDQTQNPDSTPKGFRKSQNPIQPPRTITVSLAGSEDEILARMKSKTRYNIRLAAKKGVEVRMGYDVDQLYTLMDNTSDRSAFGIHTRSYYQDAFRIFSEEGKCRIFLAEFEGKALASIMVFLHGRRSWYFYGGSSNQHRDKMPTYLIQWEAMRWVKSEGCEEYDLWGVPDEDLDTLEENFTKRGDGLWGVYRFKRGFGGELKRTKGPWDRVYKPLIYFIYSIRTRFRPA